MSEEQQHTRPIKRRVVFEYRLDATRCHDVLGYAYEQPDGSLGLDLACFPPQREWPRGRFRILKPLPEDQ